MIVPILAIVGLVIKEYRTDNIPFLTGSFLLLFAWFVLVLMSYNLLISYEYLFLWIPVPLAFVITSNVFWKGKRARFLMVTTIVIIALMPNLSVFLGTNQILNHTAGLPSIQEKIAYINDRADAMTHYTWVFRANKDNWKFLLSGGGQCGETASASLNLMLSSGVVARAVDIPGEHAFVEVNVNGDWMVSDGSVLITRSAMTEKRINDVGCLSYITAPTQNSFIELTRQ